MPIEPRITIGVLLAVTLLGCPPSQRGDDDDPFDPSELPQGTDSPRTPTEAVIVELFDGDTAAVVIDGFDDTVRFLNIDTPEVGECWSSDATARSRELLPEGSTVWLTWDGEQRDGFGRLLCHLFAGAEPTEADWVNLTLVREGDAREFVFDENDTYRAEFEAAEAAARQEDAGMWGACDAVDR